MKKIIWIILILMIGIVYAEQQTINTNIDIGVYNGTVKVKGENNEFNYNCSENITHTQSFTLYRNIQGILENNMSDLKEVCKEIARSNQNITLKITDMLTKVTDSHELYVNCYNELSTCKSKRDYKEDLDKCEAEKTTLTAEKTVLQGEKENCLTQKIEKENKLATCEADLVPQNTIVMYCGIALAVGIAGTLFFQKRKKPKDVKDMEGHGGLF